MILAAAIVWGVAAVVACGGDLRRLGRAQLRHEGLVLCLFLVQGIVRGRLPFAAEWSRFSVIVWALSGVILLCVLRANMMHTAVSVMVLGLGLNMLVVLANGGMPVAAAAGALPATATNAGFYHLVSDANAMVVLADVLPSPGGWMVSMGDVLLAIGVSAHIVAACSSRTVLSR